MVVGGAIGWLVIRFQCLSYRTLSTSPIEHGIVYTNQSGIGGYVLQNEV